MARDGRSTGTSAARHRSGRSIEQIIVLTIAIAFGLLGFLVSAFWLVAVVVMAVLWGLLVANLRRPASGGGGDAPPIGALIEEGRSFVHEHATAPADPATSTAAAELDELTRDQLYERAQAANIPGRSSMTKEQLREALER